MARSSVAACPLTGNALNAGAWWHPRSRRVCWCIWCRPRLRRRLHRCAPCMRMRKLSSVEGSVSLSVAQISAELAVWNFAVRSKPNVMIVTLYGFVLHTRHTDACLLAVQV